PRINLNDQPWRQPVEFDSMTASLRLQQGLGKGWNFVAHALQQRLRTNDRTAFPFGVYDPATYLCSDWCDRYAPDGSFTYWEYISNNERRTSSALQLAINGRWQTAAVQHRLEAGVLWSRQRGRFEDQVFDIAGTGRIDGSLLTPRSAGFTDANTNRDDDSTEVFFRDAVALGNGWQVWAGMRHTLLQRRAERTSAADADGLRGTHYRRRASTPWLAVAHELTSRTMLYASWGKGLETEVAPNRSRYANAGQSLELSSRQWEIGVKHGSDAVEAGLTYFDIDRGKAIDSGSCGGPGTCVLVIDGSTRHQGVEAQGTLAVAQWRFGASAMLLAAQRQGSAQPGMNGRRPANVPARSLRLNADYSVAAVPGLALHAGLVAEGDRIVLPDVSDARIAGWSRVDLGARWRQPLGSNTLIWRLGLDNATDRRAWKEAPYQFSHVYLYPLPPRTWRASLEASF
ncbi:MAG TPA: TonB-dependent receptor, partial [Rubrivivax sp.]|nr:TonB-dependent receptor [Rubrivivax sp.]